MSTPRIITDHKVNGLNEAIEVSALDAAGPGGANHVYSISLSPPERPTQQCAVIQFQNGPIAAPADMNGLTNEALLAIVIDRMRGFQHGRKPDGTFDFNARGQYACKENACALTHIEEGLMWLQKRTHDRMKRGVEGTHAL